MCTRRLDRRLRKSYEELEGAVPLWSRTRLCCQPPDCSGHCRVCCLMAVAAKRAMFWLKIITRFRENRHLRRAEQIHEYGATPKARRTCVESAFAMSHGGCRVAGEYVCEISSMCTCTYGYVCMCVCVHVHIYIYVCVYVCMYVCTS